MQPAQTKTTKIDISYVLEHTDLIDLALEYGLDLIEQTGGDYICLCPFHDDHETPSFRIYSLTNTWCCFGGCKGSSVFDFVMLQDKIDFNGALMKLAAAAGYAGTYVLKDIRDNEEIDRFSSQKDKIELAISQKYTYIYNKLMKLESGRKDELFIKLQEFWDWYDRVQDVFNKKSWESAQPSILDSKLYEFYSKALTRLESVR